MHLILNGEVGLYLSNRKISSRGPKNYFGEIDNDSEYSKNYKCMALTPMATLVLKIDQYNEIMQGQKNSQRKMIFDFIKKIPCFRNLLYNKIERLAECIQVVNYPMNEIIYNIGDIAKEFFIVKDGIIELETCVTVKQKQNIPTKQTIISTKKFSHRMKVCITGELFGHEEVENHCRRYAKAISKDKDNCCFVINAIDFNNLLTQQEKEEIYAFFEPRVGSRELRRRVTRELSGKKINVNAIFDAARVSPMQGCFTDRKVHRKVDWANKVMERYQNSINSRLIFENHEAFSKTKGH